MKPTLFAIAPRAAAIAQETMTALMVAWLILVVLW